jgi:hypothetical protein
MRADYRVFMDACVLANQGVCDLLYARETRIVLAQVVEAWEREAVKRSKLP